MKKLFSLLGLIVVIAVSFFAVMLLFRPGYFPMHDDTQVTRVYEMTVAIKDGMFPVRWTKDLGYGYGYPIFNFYAPFAYYVGSTIQLLGFTDALTATKLMIVIGVIFAGVTMYFLAKSFWGVSGGVVAGILYVFAPYHAVNVYVRGAIAETWAYAFVPLAFYGLWMVYTQRKWRYVIIGSLGFAGVILSHNLTAMMILPFYLFLVVLFSMLIIKSGEKRSWVMLPLMAIIAFAISAFYWIPAISEMGYTNVKSQIGGGSVYSDHFVCPVQLWDSPWGFGGSAPGCIDGMSLKIGKAYIIFSVVAFVLGLFFIRSDNKKRNTIVFSFLSLLFVSFLMTEYSGFLWNAITPMAYFQFPWRFLLLASFIASFLAGAIPYIVSQIKPNTKVFLALSLIVSVGMVSLVLYQNLKLFLPFTINDKKAADYTERKNIVWKISKISDEYMPKNFAKPKREKDVVSEKITSIESIPNIDITKNTTTNLTASIETNEPAKILVNTAYFPSWNVSIDGKKTKYKVEKNGMSLTVPEGKHVLEVIFTQTEREKLANWISLAGVGVLILGIIAAWRIKSL